MSVYRSDKELKYLYLDYLHFCILGSQGKTAVFANCLSLLPLLIIFDIIKFKFHILITQVLYNYIRFHKF